MRFDHIGVATPDALGLAEEFGGLLDARIAHEEEFDGMQIVFLDLGEGYVEFIEPLTDEGPIASALEESGPGLHHLALATDDIEAELDAARERDVRCIDDEPRPGAWGHQVAFLHPADTGGVLLELVEH